jgi:hypothetical protein
MKKLQYKQTKNAMQLHYIEAVHLFQEISSKVIKFNIRRNRTSILGKNISTAC